MLTSLFSDSSLAEIKSLITHITSVEFNIQKPDHLDDLKQKWVFKFVGELPHKADYYLKDLARNNIIKVKRYAAGLQVQPIVVICECDMEKLNLYYAEQCAAQHLLVKKPKPSINDCFQPVDISHRLYLALANNKYQDFIKILKEISHGKIDQEIKRLSIKIQKLTGEHLKKALSSRLETFKDNCRHLRFADALLISDDYDKKNKKISAFLKRLESEVIKFELVSEEHPEQVFALHQTAKKISDDLSAAHSNRLFSCTAKSGNRSKMAAYISKVLAAYPIDVHHNMTVKRF